MSQRHSIMEQRSTSIVVLLSVLFAFAWSANARKDSGGYWKGVMKEEPMPAALEALILPNPSSQSLVKKPNCHHDAPTTTASSSGNGHHPLPDTRMEDNVAEKPLVKNFEPRPNVSSYHDGDLVEQNHTEMPSNREDKTSNVVRDIPVAENFEPRPNVSAYGD